MCGICGQFRFGDGGRVLPETIYSMVRSLRHRGPDDEGTYFEHSIGLGFRRLSIIDVHGGHQPMSSTDGNVQVLLNGEIYNFGELRSELETLGHHFRSRSDTEVVVHGYQQWGTDVLDHLNGMFGLAVWDAESQQLMVARDRMGIKLVYYHVANGCLSFGSEMRPLLAIDKTTPNVDARALRLFLQYRYTPSPYTILEGIRKLAAGMCLIARPGSLEEKRWWGDAPGSLDDEISPVIAEQRLAELYQQAVKRQLVSDVPVGLLLSAGIDSALLLALMNNHGSAWPTFTVGYGRSFVDDEIEQAAETARLLGSDHTSVLISKSEFESALPAIIRHLEEPVASSSVVPMFFVCQRARERVKVALIGQGPDELFGGYLRHLAVRYGHLWRSLPPTARAGAQRILQTTPRTEYLQRAFQSLHVVPRLARYSSVFSLIPPSLVQRLFREPDLSELFPAQTNDSWPSVAAAIAPLDELGGFQRIELRYSLPDELLMYADKLSMAHGLELRVPYLDQHIVDFAERLPERFKVNLFRRKHIHKRVASRYLPKAVIRRKKRGFAVNVVDAWFRSEFVSPLKDVLCDDQSLMYEYLDRASVTELAQQHQVGERDNHKVLFSLTVLEHWLRQLQETQHSVSS